ncbi:SdrD B-like protein [Lentzea atacamensis]|uniref:SdrD B-like protein n=1 Tax=Lentzea atacamensis TaxID=531938 RepID=A0A316IE45_9PSEU|nr:SdrD B-like protein [Lentzea atacamensis]
MRYFSHVQLARAGALTSADCIVTGVLGDSLSGRSVGRALLRFAALTTAAAMAFGSTSVAAFGQTEPTATSTPPAETPTPQPTSQTPPPPPPSNEPAPPPIQLATTGSVSGVLYADKDRNGRQDPGEAIAGGTVTIFGGSDSSEHKAISATDGKFAFRDLTPGTYHPTYTLADGWVVHHTTAAGDLITVAANQTTEVSARAERPFSEQLKVTASLDRESYKHPANATIKLQLTNTTDHPIDGIQAACDREESANSLGRAEGWKQLKGSGLRIEAGDQRTIFIVEEIPAGAREQGSVTLDCDFAPFVNWNPDGPSVHDEAAVTGGVGGYTMLLGYDWNADNRVDPAEAIHGAEVVLLHQQTGVQVAEGRSGQDGKIEFTGLAPGEYRAVVLGGWAFRDAGQDLVRITGEQGSGYRILKYARPADLRGAVKFEKTRYESHETVRMWLTVTNIGGQTAERARLETPIRELDIPESQWGEFGYGGAGIRIPAGESRTFEVTGKIRDIYGGQLRFWRWISYLGRPNPHNSGFEGLVEVVQTRGDITGVVYTDRNRNGQQDHGEAAADVVVEANGGAPHGYFKTTTDVSGRFSFNGVPSGSYWVGYTLADGWLVHIEGDGPQSWVEPGASVQLTARAERPYRETLKATVVLDKATYAVGDLAKITITLTNTGDREISGIQAACNRIGDGNHLGGSDEDPMTGWGDLSYWGKGVTVGPRETRTFVVTEKVPTAARNKRRVVIACDFAPNPGYNTDGPYGFDWASVPGGSGGLTGPLYHDRNGNYVVDAGEAIPNTRILLLTDKENGFAVAETVSDDQGTVRFEQVPPGNWWAWVDGPWKFEGEWGGHVQVFGDVVASSGFPVVPGPPPGPEPGGDPGTGDPVDTGDTDDSAGGGTGSALAKTGASVLGLGVLAVLLVAFGLGARVAGRRRTS